MAIRFLINTALAAGALLLASDAMAATAVTSASDQRQPTQASISSRISEVDACNQAQYQIPETSVLQGFRFGTSTDKEGPLFNCTVSWSNDSKAAPTERPILFPNSVHIPIIWSGWF